MKTFDERKKSVQGYLKKAKARKRALTALKVAVNIACVVAIIIGLMHIPYGRQNAGVAPTYSNTYPGDPTNRLPTVDDPTEPTFHTYPTNWPTYPSPTIGTWPSVPPQPQNSISVTIWVASEEMKLAMSRQIDEINDAGMYDKPIVPDFYVYTTDEVRLKLMEIPPDIWPDIVCVDQTDLRYLAMCDVLTPFYEEDKAAITGKSDDLSVKAAGYEGHIYGAPLYHKDAYFLYYDRSVISDREAESLESIISACEKAGKKFCFDLDNPYYQAAFYLGAGWDSYWINDRDGRPVSYQDNLNSRVGELALQGMQTLLNSSCYITPGQDGMYSNLSYEEAYKQSAAIVGGTWDYGMIVPYIENLGITKLPTYETEDGTRQLGSFAYTMMLAVPRKNGEDGSDLATQLVLYLTNETNQLDNWHEWSWIPTNTSTQCEIETYNREKRDRAFISQIPFTVPMEDFPQQWWDYLDNVASNLVDGMSVTHFLQDYQRSMDEVVADYPAEWFVVGQVNGSFWNAEYRLVGSSDWNNLLITDQPLYFEEDSEFLLMYLDRDDSIKEFYGQDGKSAKVNFKPGLTGYYYVVYDPATGECTFRQAQPE